MTEAKTTPEEKAPEAKEKTSSEESPREKKVPEGIYKILVVDDEPDLEALVMMRMRKEVRSGMYCFVFAHNGVEALEMIKKEGDIDMVLSDINMPQMDGLTLLQEISESETDLRAVIISAYGDMKNIRTAMNRGAFDFIIKPIDFDDFRATISRGLSQLAQWREALESQNKLLSLQNELDVARTIQQSILPSNMPESETFQVEGSMVPARDVGGDFYYVEELDDGKMALAVADVSDKGVPAALFMMLTRSLLKGLLREVGKPSEIMGPLNELLMEDNTSAMFVTFFYAVYDPKTGKLDFANAGHNPPLLVRKDGKTELLPMTGGIALGVSSGWEVEEKSLELKPGESVVFYTDGVTEAVDDKDNEFGTDRLGEVPAKIGGADAVELSAAVFEAVKQFTGETPQFDDITCLTLHRRP